MNYLFVTLLLSVIQLIYALPIQERSIKSLWGVTYTARNSNGTCQTPDQISQTIQRFKSDGIMNIRTYSQECNQLEYILKAIQEQGNNMSVLAAAWVDGSSSDEQEIQQLISTLSNATNPSAVNAIAIGNEQVFSKTMSAEQVISNIKQVKSSLKNFKVGTVETPTTYTQELIEASDIVIVNIHPFFAPVAASDAADNLVQQYEAFASKVNNKTIYVGETGWPTAGDSNGAAVPSVANLATYIKNIVNTNLQYYFFESIDSSWKSGGQYDVEQHWGLWLPNGTPKVPSEVA